MAEGGNQPPELSQTATTQAYLRDLCMVKSKES